MKKQNIEDIFSSIEHFSSVPPPELWDKIEEELDKPKKKKRTILWWSAAASLLIGLSIPSMLYFNATSEKSITTGTIENKNILVDKEGDAQQGSKTTPKNNNPIQLEKTIRVSSIKQKPEEINNTSVNQSKTVVAEATISNELKAKASHNKAKTPVTTTESLAEQSSTREEKLSNGLSNNQNTRFEIAKNNASKKSNDLVLNTTIPNKNNATIASNAIIPNKNNTKEATASNTFDSKNNVTVASNAVVQNKNNTKEAVVNNTFDSKNNNTAASNTVVQNKNNTKEAVVNNTFDSKNNNTVASNTVVQNKNNAKEAVANITSDSKNNTTIASNSSIQNKTKSDLTETKTGNVTDQKMLSFNGKNGATTPILLSKTDSIQLAELHKLEESIKNSKKEKEIEDKIDAIAKVEKWSVEVFAGIANSENYKNDKTLGNVNSPKQSNAYGVKTNYKLNKKWAVSSGFKINELGQSIANVSYINTKSIAYMSPESLTENRSASPRITSSRDFVFVATSNNDAVPNSVTNGIVNTSNFESGDVDQRLKYLEMPFEVSYFILNKNKTTVSLNTGGFVGKLISNDVYLNGSAIGDNQNANDFVYGSLLSSTLQYRLYKKTNVFVEPGMNYYVNPLNNQSFNQFQWSFNFGLNVSF